MDDYGLEDNDGNRALLKPEEARLPLPSR